MLLALRILVDRIDALVGCYGASVTIDASSCSAAGEAAIGCAGAVAVANAAACGTAGEALAECTIPVAAAGVPACHATGVRVEHAVGGSAHYRGRRKPAYAVGSFAQTIALAPKVFAHVREAPKQAPARAAVASAPLAFANAAPILASVSAGVSLKAEGADGGGPIPRDPWRRARWVHAWSRSLRATV